MKLGAVCQHRQVWRKDVCACEFASVNVDQFMRKRRCRFLVLIAAVGAGYKLKEHLALDVKVRHDRTMAGFDGDLEKAFTNGDPEAVLDFLALRSHQMQRCEDEEDPACSVPLFTTDNDMAAFVRDLTIDDAISLCFADLPSGYDGTVMSSTPVVMPSLPEKKLADPSLAAGSVPPHKQATDANRRPAAVRDTLAGEGVPQSSNRHSRGKPRGFLSSLLGRGHKGRRGGSHRKPPPHQNDTSSKPTDPPASSTFSLEEDLKKTSVASESTANTRQHHNVPAGWKPELLLDGLSNYPNQVVGGKQEKPDVKQKHLDILPLGDTNVEQVTYDTDPVGLIEFCFQHPDPNSLGTVEHRLEPTAPHSDHHAMTKAIIQSGHVVFDHAHNRSTECSEAMMSSSRCTNRPQRNDLPVSLHSHVRSDLSLPSKHTEKHGSRQPMAPAGHSPDRIRQDRPAVLPSQTLLQTSKCPATERNAKLHPAGQVQFPQIQQGETDQTVQAQKPWEGLCDGIDAFIDFERDPNLEVPLDSHLSAQFHFERRASETCSQGNGEHDEVLGSKLLAAEGSEAAYVTLQVPAVVPAERMTRPGDGQQVMQTSLAVAPNCASSLQNAPLSSPVPQLTPSKMSTSTQTEKADWEPWERSIPKVGQCLRTAITQLSSLSACSSCQEGASKTLAALKEVLMEVEEAGVPPETDSVPQGKDSPGQSLPRGHSITCSTDKQTDRGLSDRAAADHTSEGSPPRHADRRKTDGPGKHRSHDSKSGPQGHRRPQQSHREAGANSKTSVSGKHPEHSSKRSKLSGAGKKQTTSSRASVPSDSDSTSTVTSEPITVLSCQRGNRSSSESSKAGHVSAHVVTADHPLDADTGDDETARSELPASRSSSRMDFGPAPASDLDAATELSPMHSAPTVETALISTATSRHRKDSRSTRSSSRYTGEADRDYESFMTSSWSEMTSVSSVSDVVTSADESSYYSGDDDNDDDEDEDEDDEGNDMLAVVRLGLLDEDRDETELRHHRLQRHLAAVLRQSSIPSTTVETVVAATGERLNSQERHVSHVNQGALYPFSSRDSFPALPGQESTTSAAVSAPVARSKDGRTPVAGLHASASAASTGREARSVRKAKKGGGVPRLFSPDRQVSLVSARQMTSEEFREGYDRSTDITKVKRSQLDGDIPWDLIPCSDTDDDAGSDKAWYNVTSEEESLAQAYCSDTDSSTTVSDW